MPRELSPASGGRRRAAVAAVVAAVAGLFALTPGAARADGGLVSADPPAGAVLTAAPAEVTLDFDAGVDEGQSHVAVLDAASRPVTDTEATRAGSTRLRLPLRLGAPGDYTVAYHVTFADGTSATGAHRFSVGTGVAPAPLDDAARRASADVVVDAHGHGIDGFSAFLLFVDGAVLAAVLALLWLRPRGRAMVLRVDESRT
ncbi:copper resistance protein CopC [Micromonospora sp. KC207]|uniref:copper resistance CopC family protein n=1 Tax=Micromonospora sp. KC207 TaxID=2530377 RepID=UPI001048A1E7|nr:copper resistance CopC family protein [Micromonospora sp. KC207]TDC63638.1 copper resistance protein CopC [Micromonospora sp. KC207]